MSLIFDASADHGQIVVFRLSLANPYNDWTEAHMDQGFTWREGSVSFGVEDPLSCLVEVLLGDESTSINDSPKRVILVPFKSDGNGVAIGDGLCENNSLNLPSGEYQLSFELFDGYGEDRWGVPYDYFVRLRFSRNDNPEFNVVKHDEDLNFQGYIETRAEPAK